MSNGLKGQWGVQDPAQAGSDQQRKDFQAAFQKELGVVNGHLQYTAAHAEKARHDPVAARRDVLTVSFQAALAQIDPKNPAKAQGAIDKVLGNARALVGEAARFREESEQAYDAWQKAKPGFDEAVTHIEALEAWEDKAAAGLRSAAEAIQKQDNARQYAAASKGLDALCPKLEPVYEAYLKQKEAKEKYDPALATLQPALTEAMAKGSPKLQPMQDEMKTVHGEMESAAAQKDFVKALEGLAGLQTKVDAYKEALAELQKQKEAYEAALAEVKPKLADVAKCSFRKLEPMQNDLHAVQEQMQAAATEDDFTKALGHVQDLSTQAETIATQAKELEEQKKAYDAAVAPLAPRLAKAAASTDEAMKPQQSEIAGLQKELEGAGEAEEFERGVQLCTDLAAKLDAFEKGVPADGVKLVVPVEKTLKLASPVELKGAYCKVSAELQVKLKGSLELASSKDKPQASTDISPLGYADGLVMRVGETWYHGEGAQICGVQTGIVESKLVGEAKVADGIEFSFAGSVKFANGEEVKLKFTIVKVGEEKVSGPGAELSYAFKSVTAKVKVETATFSGTIQLTMAGKVQPDYAAIGKLIAEKVGTRVAQIAASVAAGEALVAAGAVAISVAIIYGTFRAMAQGSEIRGLYPLSEKATNQMVDAYVAGFQGGGSAGGAGAEGHRLGAAAFAKLKQGIAAKVPDVTDEEIREKANIASKRGFIWSEVNPKAKQAVWQAFAEANRGDKQMLRNGHANLFGRLPGDSDANYTAYLED